MSTAAEAHRKFTRRREAVVRTRRRRTLIRLAIVAGIVAIIYGLFWSPLLRVRDVKVQGAKQTGRVAVADALAVEGENLLRISTSELAARVETLPWVADAEVDRMLPGAIRVRIQEREPAVVIALGAARWTLDAEGNVLDSGEAATGLPVLAGIELETIEPGISLAEPSVVGALAAYRALSKDVRTKVEALFAPSPERITFSLRGGTQVRYGAAEKMRAKNKVLAVVLGRLKREGTIASYVDVRVPTSPAVVRAAAPMPTAFPTVAP